MFEMGEIDNAFIKYLVSAAAVSDESGEGSCAIGCPVKC